MTIFKEYPSGITNNLQEVQDQLRLICNTRKSDITQFNNLQQIFIGGRKVGRIPSSSLDVITGDVIGDFNVTSAFAYYLINNAGTPEWRKVAVGSW